MSSLKTRYERDGYVVLPGLLSRSEADFYRAEIQKISGVGDADCGSKVFECPDGVSKHQVFWPLIHNERLVATIRELVGPDARYTQHSDLHAHRGGVNWHRDSACRKFGVGDDWDESRAPYNVLRVAIYLQTFEESKSSLGVVPGSHRFEQRLTDQQWAEWQKTFLKKYRVATWKHRFGLGPKPEYPDRAMTMWTQTDFDPARTMPTTPVWIRTEPGDTVIFNQKLFHSASPLLGPKYAVYLSYAAENEHARNHMAYYRNLRKELGYGPLDPALVKDLKSRNLFIDAPDEELALNGAWRPGMVSV
jgi:hypothetical protein